MRLTALSFVLFLSLTAIAQADTIAVSRFATEGLTGWDKEIFTGETGYSIVREGGQAAVKSHSMNAASGMFRKVRIDPQKHRYLGWSWKVAGILGNRSERTKAGDDYSARVYVIFPGVFFWQTKAISYVWAGRLPKEQSFPNPFTRNAMMVVVESGSGQTGTWITEQRDILADYRRLFGGEPRQVGAVAIMTDTDNSGGEATAWYGEITLSSTAHTAK